MSFSLIWEGKKLGKKNGDERVFPPCQQMFSLQNEEKIWGKNLRKVRYQNYRHYQFS